MQKNYNKLHIIIKHNLSIPIEKNHPDILIRFQKANSTHAPYLKNTAK